MKCKTVTNLSGISGHVGTGPSGKTSPERLEAHAWPGRFLAKSMNRKQICLNLTWLTSGLSETFLLWSMQLHQHWCAVLREWNCFTNSYWSILHTEDVGRCKRHRHQCSCKKFVPLPPPLPHSPCLANARPHSPSLQSVKEHEALALLLFGVRLVHEK